MKVRLYRGPFNGKVMNVRDDEYIIVLAKADKTVPVWLNPLVFDDTAPFNITNHRYRKVMMSVDGKVVPSVHPDGAVFFEYDKPRRK